MGATRIRQFLSAMWHDFWARMSGPLSVPFTFASLLVPNTVTKVLFGVLAILAFLITAYRVWLMEHEVVERLRGLPIESREAAVRLLNALTVEERAALRLLLVKRQLFEPTAITELREAGYEIVGNVWGNLESRTPFVYHEYAGLFLIRPDYDAFLREQLLPPRPSR